MTQSSRPQAGNKNPVYGNAAYIDAGPWSRDQWAQKLIIEWVGDYVTTRGPFAKYLNRLEVTNPAGVTIQVDTGAGYCNGSLLDNNAAATFTVTAPAGNPRIDTVCIVENNTNTAVADGTEAQGWIFPTDLTDYSGAASIPPYSARLVIVKGTENAAPVAPTLDQSGTLYMIPLAQYEVSIVPAISDLTDMRDYVDAEEKVVFVPVTAAYNITDSTDIPVLEGPTFSAMPGVVFPDDKICNAYAVTIVPSDFIEDFTIQIVCATTGNGDGYFLTTAVYCACGELNTTHVDTGTLTVFPVAANALECVSDAVLTVPAIGDIVRLLGQRDAVDVLDTISAVTVLGFKITYFGWRVA